MAVDFLRSEVAQMMTAWNTIRDCIAGDFQIKLRREFYLPRKNPEDRSPEALRAYNSYLQRAIFYNVTKRTLAGLVGQVFLRDPQVKLPDGMAEIENDCTGSGLSLAQFARRLVQFTVSMGRVGLLVDYPDTQGLTTQQMQLDNYVRPTLQYFGPQKIFNWRTITIGARTLLSLVVIQEEFVMTDDGFEAKMGQQFRALRLVPLETALGTNRVITTQQQGANAAQYAPEIDLAAMNLPIDNISEAIGQQFIYQQEIWRKQEGVAGHGLFQVYWPKDATGKYWDHIPFIFVGSENNDADVDNPPMADLAALNIKHYQDSADYQESIKYQGQPTLVITGVTQDWVTNVLGGVVTLGARTTLPLPVGADAKYVQPPGNPLAQVAMKDKEEQMEKIGAKLVDVGGQAKTATEAEIDAQSERSALAVCAQNVSEAMEQALQWCAEFMGLPDDDIEYDLNTEFDLIRMQPQELQAVIAAWQQDALATSEMRNSMRRGGYASLDDAEYLEEVKAKQEQQLEQAKAMMPPAPVDDAEDDTSGDDQPGSDPFDADVAA